MKSITKLADEQKSQLESWARKWVEIGLSCEPADWEASERGIRACYRHAELPEPRVFVRVASPIVLAWAAPIADAMLRMSKKGTDVGVNTMDGAVEEEIESAVRGAMERVLQYTVEQVVLDEVYDLVRKVVQNGVYGVGSVVHAAAMGDQIMSVVYGKARHAMRLEVGAVGYGAVGYDEVTSAIGDVVHDKVTNAIGEVVNAEVRANMKSVIPSVMESGIGIEAMKGDPGLGLSNWYKYIGGQFWVTWPAFWSFFDEVCGLKIPHELTQLMQNYCMAQKSSGWWWPHSHFCMVSDRPAWIDLKNGRLHSDSRAAIQWRDGWGIYALNGVRVPREIVETPIAELNPKLFTQERNAEVRREILRKTGPLWLQQKLGSRLLDQQVVAFPLLLEMDIEPETATYELHELNLGGETGPWPYLKMWNPSEQCWHIEAVPKDCTTVQQALNFRNGGEFIHLAPLS